MTPEETARSIVDSLYGWLLGNEPTGKSPREEMEKIAIIAIREVVLAEREACAKVADGWSKHVAQLIRNRR